jgi:hypothetical protein
MTALAANKLFMRSKFANYVFLNFLSHDQSVNLLIKIVKYC